MEQVFFAPGKEKIYISWKMKTKKKKKSLIYVVSEWGVKSISLDLNQFKDLTWTWLWRKAASAWVALWYFWSVDLTSRSTVQYKWDNTCFNNAIALSVFWHRIVELKSANQRVKSWECRLVCTWSVEFYPVHVWSLCYKSVYCSQSNSKKEAYVT